jgi:hypothetical protein
MGDMAGFNGVLHRRDDEFLTRKGIEGGRSFPCRGHFIRHIASINKKTPLAPAKPAVAHPPNTYRCFLPDLTGLGAGKLHGA